MSADGMTVRRGNGDDADRVAQLHCEELAESFLAELGAPFLTLLYRRIAASPGSFLLVAELDRTVVGFVAGSEDTRRLYVAFAVRDGVRVLGVAARPLARRVRRSLETLRYGRRGAGAHADLPAAELLSLAVSRSHRGRQLGSGLVAAFQGELVRRGVASAKVTVASSNERAIQVYARSGFRPAITIEVHRGSPSEVLVWP